jgi:hypothetical protein
MGHFGVGTGRIKQITSSTITIICECPIRLLQRAVSDDIEDFIGASAIPKLWRIDRIESSTFAGTAHDNLHHLMDNCPESAKLRRLIIDGRRATFDNSLIDECAMSSHFNSEQRKAAAAVLSAKDYALILGVPGAGMLPFN